MPQLVDIIDDLIQAPKEIAGAPDWQPGPRSGQQRWLASLAIDGTVCELKLVVDAYPREPSLKFTISLVCGAAVVRLDYGELEMHFNHVVPKCATPSTVELGWLDGSHIHGWSENKDLFGHEPPKELEFAVSLPPNMQGFANCFRWFCGEHNINLDGVDIPVPPPKDTLL